MSERNTVLRLAAFAVSALAAGTVLAAAVDYKPGDGAKDPRQTQKAPVKVDKPTAAVDKGMKGGAADAMFKNGNAASK